MQSNDTGASEDDGILDNEQDVDIPVNSVEDSEPCESDRFLPTVDSGAVVDYRANETLALPAVGTPLLPTAPDASPAASSRKSDPGSPHGSPVSGYPFIHSLTHSFL